MLLRAGAAVTGVTAVASVTSLGEETVTAGANVAVTGPGLTSTLGTVTQKTSNTISVTGLAGNFRSRFCNPYS